MLIYNISKELKAAGVGKYHDFLKCLSLLTAGALDPDEVVTILRDLMVSVGCRV